MLLLEMMNLGLMAGGGGDFLEKKALVINSRDVNKREFASYLLLGFASSLPQLPFQLPIISLYFFV